MKLRWNPEKNEILKATKNRHYILHFKGRSTPSAFNINQNRPKVKKIPCPQKCGRGICVYYSILNRIAL